MQQKTVDSTLRLQGRIDAKVHSVSVLESHADGEWDELSNDAKMQVAREVEPAYQETVYNVTTDRFHEYLVDNLDPGNTTAEANVSAAWLALGTDGAAGTSTTDTDLNNRTYSETVTDHADNGSELLASTFLDSTEGNGNSFDEIGLVTGDPANISTAADVFLINHASFSAIAKDDTNTITFDVTLTFSDV